MLTLLLLTIVGFIAGFVDTIAGGGGMLTVPAYLMAGLPPHITLGTNKLSGVASVANASRIFIKKKIFLPQLWVAALIAVFCGGLIGATLVLMVSSRFLQHFLPLMILLLAIYVIIPKKYSSEVHDHYQPKKFSSSLLGALMGFYDGFIGPGTGSIWVVALMGIYKIKIVEATGIAKLMNCFSSLAALTVFIIAGNVYYGTGLLVAAAMMLGAYFGAHTTIRYGTKFIRPIFLIIVVVLALRLAWQNWGMLI